MIIKVYYNYYLSWTIHRKKSILLLLLLLLLLFNTYLLSLFLNYIKYYAI
ncbi:MAG: hypothetical protein N7Q72_01125 [Spiroplasma sp. Tabriz.8]|nr:hypothetical protein [Spiroplasma sp. Tabriz.8]